jgi:hypothetical protein
MLQKISQPGADDYGAALSNAIFHCSANCSFIRAAVELHPKMFSPDDWASGGSKLLTGALKQICKVRECCPFIVIGK